MHDAWLMADDDDAWLDVHRMAAMAKFPAKVDRGRQTNVGEFLTFVCPSIISHFGRVGG